MGKNKVRFEKNGLLYVEYNDSVIKIKNPYPQTPTHVDVVVVGKEMYIKGFEPVIETKTKDFVLEKPQEETKSKPLFKKNEK